MQRKRMTVDAGVMILGIYTGLLLIAEFATTRNLKTGMIAHGCILVVLLLHSTIAENRYFSNLYASLSIIPLIRILSLCIPLMHFEYILWFLIVGVPLFAAIFTCIYIQRIDLRCEKVDISAIPAGTYTIIATDGTNTATNNTTIYTPTMNNRNAKVRLMKRDPPSINL